MGFGYHKWNKRNYLQSIGGLKSMFKFRLIDMPNGLQIIDENLMTPYDSITPEQMIDYIRVEQAMEVIKIHKRNREIHNMERNKLKTILFRIACMLLN